MTSKDALSIGTDVKPPVLFKGEYEQWKDRFLDFVDPHSNGENILLSITEGPMAPIMVQILDDDSSDSEDGTEERDKKMKTVAVDISQYSEEHKSRYKEYKQARFLLLLSIPNEIYIKIDSYKGNAKKMWDQLQKMMMGSKVRNQMKVANCINSYEEFKAKENESLEDTYEWFVLLLNELSKNKVKKKQLENNVKFLSILQPEWKKHTRRMKQMKDLNDIPLHEVYETLRQNEEEVEEKKAEKKKAEKVPNPIALVAGEKKKEKKEKKKKKKVITSSKSESESDGRRYEEDRYVEKKPDDRKKYMNDYTVVEKPASDSVKCYNSGKIGHFAKDCRKPKVRNSQYYQNKLLLAKQQEAGIALMAEDEFWLDHSEDDETTDEVLNLTEKDFVTKMEAMMVELNDLQLKLKKEKDRVAKRNNKIFELNKSVIGNKDLIDSLRKSASDSKSQVDCFEKKISDFEVENKLLNKKVNSLEAKLYARGQTDQTLFLNAPDEEADVKEKWGLGFKNLHYLKKAIRKQPTLYNFDFLACAGKHTHLKPKFVTKLPEEVEAKETENRKNVKKMQLPFNYAKLNDSYLSETPKVLSNDYFASYYVSELKAKPAVAKVYVPPLILESKIVELENVLSDEKLLVDIQQSVFSTVLKNTIFQSTSIKCSKVSKATQTSSDNFDDLFESANEFLNSDDGCIDEIDMFDFNASLPDHFTCLINEKVLPSVLKIAKPSTKVGESISVIADYYSQDVRKKRSKARTEWRPKRKGDEKVESVSDNSCNRSVSSDTDVTRHMWYLDSRCSKHMTGQKALLPNYTEKFSGNVRFGNDQFSPILGYGDIIQDNITMSKVSYVEGLGHNLFGIGQLCDKGLELVRGKLVKGLPELKYEREYLCATCEKGKMKRAAHKPNPEPSTSSPLELLHMDLCGPMRTQSLGGKKYVLVIVDDYSRYTWVKFLRSKGETPEVLITFLKTNQVKMQRQVNAKADEGIFISYSSTSATYRVYLKKSKTVVESVNVTFDEDMASEQLSSEPVITGVLASGQISLEPVSTEKNSDNASTSV
ncbi:hypothetical protein L6452_18405 [Arctium lappa]|uniref:Uncharacterized protein n=1 Tax=Arctium lappa TaxID=4217 RepID=A0ACB9C6A7_ARCLA|nr:hypothetical protein L6452_18405 [Arctium lappa]